MHQRYQDKSPSNGCLDLVTWSSIICWLAWAQAGRTSKLDSMLSDKASGHTDGLYRGRGLPSSCRVCLYVLLYDLCVMARGYQYYYFYLFIYVFIFFFFFYFFLGVGGRGGGACIYSWVSCSFTKELRIPSQRSFTSIWLLTASGILVLYVQHLLTFTSLV